MAIRAWGPYGPQGTIWSPKSRVSKKFFADNEKFFFQKKNSYWYPSSTANSFRGDVMTMRGRIFYRKTTDFGKIQNVKY